MSTRSVLAWAFIAVPASGVCLAVLAYEMVAVIPNDSSKASHMMRIECLFIDVLLLSSRDSSNRVSRKFLRGYLFLFGGAETSLLSVGLRHIFALLGLAVPAGSRLVINAGVGVDPDHAGAVGGRGLLLRRSCGL